MTKTLGPYTLVAKLGEGGMAEVFRAVKGGPHGFEKVVALKKILPPYRDDREMVAMFLEEARLHAKLHHPNLVQLIDFFEDGAALVLVMEFFRSKPLSRILFDAKRRGVPVPWPVAVHVAAETLAALAYTHAQKDGEHASGIVHRDVSPQNILVSADGFVKLTDFGIAKTDASAEKTASNILKGKIRYLAPEQIRRDPLTPRSDLFALSAVLYEMACGAHPFVAKADFETMQRISAGAFTRPADLAPAIPLALDALIVRGLATDPAERIASADDMRRALLALQHPGFAREHLANWIARIYAPADFDQEEAVHVTRALPEGDPTRVRKPRTRRILVPLFLAAAASGAWFLRPARAPEEPVADVAPTALPATAAPAPSTGRIHVTGESGTIVFVNGKKVGVLPLSDIEMAAGDYVVLLRDPRGRTVVRTVSVVGGTTADATGTR